MRLSHRFAISLIGLMLLFLSLPVLAQAPETISEDDEIPPEVLIEVATPEAFIAAVEQANETNTTTTILLLNDIVFTQPYANITDGTLTPSANALPIIRNDVRIAGEGHSIQRAEVAIGGVPPFRFFEVAPDAKLTLSDVAVLGGYVRSDANGNAAYLPEGGAILSYGNLLIENARFSGNQAEWGGAIAAFGNNAAADDAGNVADEGSSLIVRRTVFSGNEAAQGGGALALEFVPDVVLDHVLFNENYARVQGGAIATFGSQVEAFGSAFARNRTHAPDANTDPAPPNVLTQGGAIFNEGGDISIANSTFSGNSTGFFGGAIASVAINDSTTGNVRPGQVNLAFVTLKDNVVLARSGAAGDKGGAGIYTNGSFVNTYASVYDNRPDNCAAEASDPAIPELFVSDGYNNYSPNPLTSALTHCPMIETDQLGFPNLSGLIYAERSAFHWPLAGSPLIDAIPATVCETERDQLGESRPQFEGCDIGAIEADDVERGLRPPRDLSADYLPERDAIELTWRDPNEAESGYQVWRRVLPLEPGDDPDALLDDEDFLHEVMPPEPNADLIATLPADSERYLDEGIRNAAGTVQEGFECGLLVVYGVRAFAAASNTEREFSFFSRTGAFTGFCERPEADLSMEKTVDLESAEPGDVLTYTLTMTNNGPDTAFGVYAVDHLPQGVEYLPTSVASDNANLCQFGDVALFCFIGQLEPDESRSLSLTVRVLEDAEGELVNEATVISESIDPNDENNHGRAVTELQPQTPPVAEVSFVVRDDLDNAPGLQTGEQFAIDVLVSDIRDANSGQPVFSAFMDVTFDPAMLQIDAIIYDDDYTALRSGNVDNENGAIDEVGASTGGLNVVADSPLVFTLLATAQGVGTTTLTTDAGEAAISEVVLYNDELVDRRNDTRYNDLTLNIGPNEPIAEIALNVVSPTDEWPPQVQVGQQFAVELRAREISDLTVILPLFAAYADVLFDPALLQVDEVVFDPDYSNFQQGADRIDNSNGEVDDVGATAGLEQPSDDRVLVLRMTALAPGSTTISTNAPDREALEVIAYSLDMDIRDFVAYGALPLEISDSDADYSVSFFDVVNDHVVRGVANVEYIVENNGSDGAERVPAAIILSDDETCAWPGANTDPADLDDAESPSDVVVLVFDAQVGNPAPSANVVRPTQRVELPLQPLYRLAKRDDMANENLPYASISAETLCMVLNPNGALPETDPDNNLSDPDDITYFPWDVNSNGVVSPLDAIAVIRSLGRANPPFDFDGNGLLTPLEAIDTLFRLGYERNDAVFEATPADPDATVAVPIASTPTTQVQLDIVELDATPGIVAGEAFNVNVYMRDLNSGQSVFSGFVNLAFDPSLLQVDGVRYGMNYELMQSASVDNAQGRIANIGAASHNLTPSDDALVAILRVRALRDGVATLSTGQPSAATAETTLYSASTDQRNAMQHANLTISITPGITPPVPSAPLPVPQEARSTTGQGGLPIQPVNPNPTATPLPELPVQGR